MDIVEKFNRNFGTWFERLFGTMQPAGPRDVLRRVIATMESARREGLDGNIYVPNQVTVTLNMANTEELSALALFLNEPDLQVAINDFIVQEGYRLKNGLSVTVQTNVVPLQGVEGTTKDAVEISCRFSNETPRAATLPVPDEQHTVAAGFMRQTRLFDGARGFVVFPESGGEEQRVAVPHAGLRIGRSRSAGNDIVLADDTQVSRSHATITVGVDQQAYLEDLGSLNGTRLNGAPVSKVPITFGDVITIGNTSLRYCATPAEEQGTNLKIVGAFGGAAADVASVGSGPLPPSRIMRPATASLVTWGESRAAERFYLASENVIGRSPTCDIVLPSRSVCMRHALLRKQPDSTTIEKLDQEAHIAIDGVPILDMNAALVPNGCILKVGDIMLRFDSEGV